MTNPKNFKEYLNEIKKPKVHVKKESSGDWSVIKDGKVIASGLSEAEAESRKKTELDK